MFRPSLFAMLAATTMHGAPAPAQAASNEEELKLAMVDTVVVTGRRDGYDQHSTSTATKTDTPLKDVPQAVSVVTAEQIADQGLRSVTDVLRTVPGATVASGEGHRDQILLRGQNSTADFFVDGIRDDVQYYRGLYNLERVEVLKGPNAMIFGRGGGGGIVNRVTKKASDRNFVRGATGLDSHGGWFVGGDGNVRLADGLGARLNATYEDFSSFRDHVDGHRFAINPTLGWDLGDETRIDLSYEYNHDRRTVDRGIPSLNGRPLKGAQDDFFGDPDVNKSRLDAHVVDLSVSHRFSDSIRWSGKARYGDYDKAYANALAATPVQADGTVGMEAYRSTNKRQSLLIQNDFIADFATGPVRHTLLFGVDYANQDSRATRQQGYFDASPTAVNSRRRLFVPIASADDLPTITFRDGATAATDGSTDAVAWGVYVQDQAKIGEHVELVAGLRRDWFSLDYRNNVNGQKLSRDDALWSPRLGLVLKPNENVSVYGSWSKSFLPQSGDQFSSLAATTAAFEPEEFRNREVGVKWALAPRLDLTLAAYVLDRSNTRAIDNSGNTVLSGEQRSKGIEASLSGKVNDRLSIAASAALQRARYRTTSTAGAAGNDVASVPHFTTSVWGRYDFDQRFGVGAGVYHQSKFYASSSNAVKVPGYTRIDAAAYIGLTDYAELQLNVENLLGKDYIGLTHTDNNLTPGAPRTLRGTVRFSF
ncbi:TonB-dependent receptor [Sphingomonas jaspsi]|uniref:TonB-dependent receptor n=1 Tax=Sphingomonas jaspsi TaxID=392409 RepID=UPI0004BC4BAB|nr:TonB-dependent siderophore receptor [Sphingomonas jaspsi]